MIEFNIAALVLGRSLCTLWGLRVALPRQAASGLLFIGSLSMFVYLAHAPALYGLSRYVDAGAVRFFGAVILSLILALALEKASDIIVYRFVR